MGKDAFGATTTIDEALVKTCFGRFNYLVIIFSGFVINNVVLESVGISFALPILECDLKLSYKQQGILGSVGFIGIIASSHLWGFLADTTGRKRIMRPALIVECLINILSSLSPDFVTLAIMRFLNGVLLSAGSASIFAYLGEFHSHKYRNRAFLSSAFISAFLSIFFPVLAMVFINQSWSFYVPIIGIVFKPWRLYMLACGTLAFVSSVLMFFLPESPKYLLATGRENEAIAVLKHIHTINTRHSKRTDEPDFDVIALLPDLDTPLKEKENSTKKSAISVFMSLLWRQTAPLFMRAHIKKTIVASLIQFIIFFSAHGVYMWFPYILNRTMQFSQRHVDTMRLCDILRFTQSSNFSISENEHEQCATQLEISTFHHTTVLELIYVSLLLIVSYAIGKCGRTAILFLILLGCGACGVFGLTIHIPLIGIYAYVVFLCCGLGTTVVNAIVVDIYPTNLRAMAVCISLMVGRLGSVSGSSLLGVFMETNCEIALYGPAIALIIAGFLGLLLPKGKSDQSTKTSNENI